MNKINPYLFVPAIRERNLEKAFEISLAGSAKIIFDFEDSVGDLHDLVLSGELKTKARNTLMKFLSNNKLKFLLRINDSKSNFFEADKNFILELSNNFPLDEYCEGIVMSKTNNADEVKNFLDWWNKTNSFSLPIVPLIETVDGIKNLEEIAKISDVKGLIFGHHDYFMDLSNEEKKIIFPVPRSPLTSEIYRDILNQFIDIIKKSNKSLVLIDGVYSFLHDLEGIKNIGTYLYNLDTKISWGKLVLNPSQFDALNEINKSVDHKEISLSNTDDVLSNKMKLELAMKLTDKKTVHSDLKVTRIEGRYISPQERELAERFINDNSENI